MPHQFELRWRHLKDWLSRGSIWVLMGIEWIVLMGILLIYYCFFSIQPYVPWEWIVLSVFLIIILGAIWRIPFHRLGEKIREPYVRYFLRDFAEVLSSAWGAGIGFILSSIGILFVMFPIFPYPPLSFVFIAGVGGVLISWTISLNIGEGDISIHEALSSSLEFFKRALRAGRRGISKPEAVIDRDWDDFILGLNKFCRRIIPAASELSERYVKNYTFHIDKPEFSERFWMLAYVHGFTDTRRERAAIRVLDEMIKSVENDTPHIFAEKIIHMPRRLGLNQADWWEVKSLSPKTYSQKDSGLDVKWIIGSTILAVSILILTWPSFWWSEIFNQLSILLIQFLSWIILLYYPWIIIPWGRRRMKYLEIISSEDEASLQQLSQPETMAEIVLRIIEGGENETVEFKSDLVADFQKQLVAFANTRGGTILVGVSDDAQILGLQESGRVSDQIQQMAESCESPVRVENTVCTVQNKAIIIVDVPESMSMHRWRKEVYIRRGATSRPASNEERTWIIQRHLRPHRTFVELD